MNKILIILILIVILLSGSLFYFHSKKFGIVYTEVPNQKIVIIGTYHNDVFFNKATGQREIIPDTQSTPLSTPDYKWLYGYGGNIEQQILRPLNNNEFSVIGHDLASTTRMIRVMQNGVENIIKESDLGPVSLMGRFLSTADAAIKIEASSSAAQSTITSLSYSLVVPSGLSNTTIIIGATHTGTGTDIFTDATVNGVSATIGNITGAASDAPYNPTGWWYYNSPTSTTQTNIVVTKNGTNARMYSAATLWSGVSVTGSPVSASSTQGTGLTGAPPNIINNQVNTTLNEALWDNVWNSCGGDPITSIGASQVDYDATFQGGTCPTNPQQYATYKVATGTAQTTLLENLTANAAWQSILVSLKVASAVADKSQTSDALIFE